MNDGDADDNAADARDVSLKGGCLIRFVALALACALALALALALAFAPTCHRWGFNSAWPRAL